MTDLSTVLHRVRQRVSDPFVTEPVRNAVLACVEEIESAMRDADNQLLSPEEAAKECGLKPATIRKKLRTGALPNEGAPRRPKVRRRALREAMSKVAPSIRIVR